MRTKIERQVDSLVELAKEWREFSKTEYGWDTRYFLEDGESPHSVRCYFADNSDHTTVEMSHFDVAFHSPVEVSFKVPTLSKLGEIEEKSRKLLEQKKKERAAVSEEEKEREKEELKQALKQQLARLEAE